MNFTPSHLKYVAVAGEINWKRNSYIGLWHRNWKLFKDETSTWEKCDNTNDLQNFVQFYSVQLITVIGPIRQIPPRYMTDHCTPISQCFPPESALGQQSSSLRSTLAYWLSTYGRRAFTVASPTVWNSKSLPEDMRDPECSVDSYRQSVKTFLFSQH